jgi:hypothetical protein
MIMKQESKTHPHHHWNQHLEELDAAGLNEFHYRYHMSKKQAFDKLVSILSDVITVNEMKSKQSINKQQ